MLCNPDQAKGKQQQGPQTGLWITRSRADLWPYLGRQQDLREEKIASFG
jgi:hypothetical protein